ncbi:MAG: DUF4102 domain-containing protein, partial [Gammaproteobacteria bacterium]|nr:DUF4102 domain-containing protein [Gammaproteobacteria bacterium]
MASPASTARPTAASTWVRVARGPSRAACATNSGQGSGCASRARGARAGSAGHSTRSASAEGSGCGRGLAVRIPGHDKRQDTRMERPKMLNASFVKTVRRPGRYGDGRGGYGLSLLVKPTSTGRTSKTWAQRLYINGRAVNLGLGAYPLVTLREARAKAFDNRRTLARGMDPRSDGIPTFAR